MSEPIDLKAIKTKIHRTILEDGLLDIMLGIYLILSGIYLFNKSLILNYIWFPIALVLIEVIRRRYIFPRSGYVKLNQVQAGIRVCRFHRGPQASGTVIIGIRNRQSKRTCRSYDLRKFRSIEVKIRRCCRNKGTCRYRSGKRGIDNRITTSICGY